VGSGVFRRGRRSDVVGDELQRRRRWEPAGCVAGAASGDTIDMRGLSCSVIRTTGAIVVPQANLTLQGPGYKRLAIDIDWSDSVLRHTGGGLLRVRGVALLHGTRRSQTAQGGCVYSNGSVDLYDASISNCGAHGLGAGPTAGQGGGVYADGDVAVRYSAVRSTTARGGTANGGGIFAGGKVTLVRARITSNSAARGGGVYATNGATLDTSTVSDDTAARDGGGLYALGPVSIAHSTIARNVANRSGGSIWMPQPDVDALIVNSTISGNRAALWAGGRVEGDADLANATIAFNEEIPEANLSGEFPPCPGGGFSARHVHAESTIATDNVCVYRDTDAGQTGDFVDALPGLWSDDGRTTGSNNLVSIAFLMPPDTLTANARLLPLANNGGFTETHRPDAGWAWDNGNNAAGLLYDQRGAGFPRVKGAAPDIGAYEH
jgi:hypothetical protein